MDSIPGRLVRGYLGLELTATFSRSMGLAIGTPLFK